MVPGEYAVHYSSFDKSLQSSPSCTVFASLADAEQFAKEQTTLDPTLRCRIYDHQGLVGAPVSEIKGAKYVGDSDLSPRFRRWGGSFLFFGGVILTLIDWAVDFRFGWPAMVGTRMMIPGLVLLFIEAIIILHTKSEAKRKGRV